jgi:hypothetical protein
MNCCSNCFLDAQTRAIIDTNSTVDGTCDFCLTEDVKWIDAHELNVEFSKVIELYTNHPTSLRSLRDDRPYLMHEHLIAYFPSLFNRAKIEEATIKILLKEIGYTYYNDIAELFEEPVEFSCLLNPLNADVAEMQEVKWDGFVQEIRYNNRFFLSRVIDVDLLKAAFQKLSKVYHSGKIFYRARISDSILPIGEMGKPPAKSARPGRANPTGISYLYLSNSKGTTLYETRASLYETLTLGEFQLMQNLNVLSLRDMSSTSPLNDDVEQLIILRPYLQKLEKELSRPIRKQDSELDYLPTQYLCELIKSVGLDAVEYKSAMNPGGFNLAVFNDDKFECRRLEFVKVDSLTYTYSNV